LNDAVTVYIWQYVAFPPTFWVPVVEAFGEIDKLVISEAAAAAGDATKAVRPAPIVAVAKPATARRLYAFEGLLNLFPFRRARGICSRLSARSMTVALPDVVQSPPNLIGP
jgi:hypothetical protein